MIGRRIGRRTRPRVQNDTRRICQCKMIRVGYVDGETEVTPIQRAAELESAHAAADAREGGSTHVDHAKCCHHRTGHQGRRRDRVRVDGVCVVLALEQFGEQG